MVKLQQLDVAVRLAAFYACGGQSQLEIEEFVSDHWNNLWFTADLAVEKKGGRKINYKRMRRIIEREMAANARRGTKAQQAIADVQEARKAELKRQRDDRKEAAFMQKQAKRKQKHRGH